MGSTFNKKHYSISQKHYEWDWKETTYCKSITNGIDKKQQIANTLPNLVICYRIVHSMHMKNDCICVYKMEWAQEKDGDAQSLTGQINWAWGCPCVNTAPSRISSITYYHEKIVWLFFFRYKNSPWTFLCFSLLYVIISILHREVNKLHIQLNKEKY